MCAQTHRCAPEDLERERGAVLDEWRSTKDAQGRAATQYWELLLEGSKYSERLPIGLESVIRKVTPATIKEFYERWYTPDKMAVIVVGDFGDLQKSQVKALIEKSFEVPSDILKRTVTERPYFPVPDHSEAKVVAQVGSPSS